MTPAQALIDAAEDLIANVQPMGTGEHKKFAALRRALSTAKATEWTLETEFIVECQIGVATEMWASRDLESGQANYLTAVKDYPNAKRVRLYEKDTYTTVIEVREKEGL
jgi:hypothetical protein